ncbi:transcriptional regulator [Aureimonas sp. SA4125]|nr:transcriptional regulator [Aureimonas sp. SA4125]
MTSPAKTRRFLVADDDAQVLDAYGRVFADLVASTAGNGEDFDALSAELFGEGAATPDSEALIGDVVYCRQGEQAVSQVENALARGEPFAIAFIDMRMPPGIDGLETARRIRALDPNVNLVIVTGYSDHKPSEIALAIGRPEKLFYLLKPFDVSELRQLATALAHRWSCDNAVTDELALRVAELERLNAQLKASEAKAQEFARMDALTGLPNRMGLSERLQNDTHAVEGTDRQLSVLYLDLDRFKDVNDSLGHPVGDELICQFAARIREAVGDDGFAARLGGDEFAVISLDRGAIEGVVKRLLAGATEPYTMGGHVVLTSVSIGIAHSAPGRPHLVEAMRQADIALYAAKAAGRGVALEFVPSMERDILGAQRLAGDLAEAIRSDRLELYYQPLVGADGIPISSVEALLRWNHPERGFIAPMVFIEAAEKADLIRELGAWVIRRAFRDARHWPDLVTSINLSPSQLRAPDFIDELAKLVAEMSVDPTMFEFEVTESVLIDDVETAARQIRSLKDMGFKISLDDFGSGYAGLAYLSRIPFDKMKIDRSFVFNVGVAEGAEGVIRSIVGLGLALGLSITAEGVEHAAQHQVLQSAGCHNMQGFLFHRPLPVDETLRAINCGRLKIAS